MNREEIRELIDAISADQAKALGGIVATCPVDDDLVWRLVRNLDSIRLRALARALYPSALSAESEARDEPHPAIRAFLKKLGRS